MSLQVKKTFIKDDKPGMTADEKNMCLSGWLAIAPYVDMNIIRIERKDEDSGWYIYYYSESEDE